MNEKIFIEINGSRQGMFLESENTENPVLLFLHGGPGSPEIIFNEKYPSGLEKRNRKKCLRSCVMTYCKIKLHCLICCKEQSMT